MHPQSIQTYEYELGKYSTFEDTPKNLLVMGDKDSGVLALFHQEHYFSTKKAAEGEKKVTKFINNIVARVMLVPSISEESGPVLDFALVRSPAPNILVSIHYQCNRVSVEH